MNLKAALRELEWHFYGPKKHGWPLVMSHYTANFEDQIKVAAAFITKHPRCNLYWDSRWNLPHELNITKWSIAKTIKYYRGKLWL
jgi:hypothetical protein